MYYLIEKDRHRARPFSLALWWKKKSIEMKVCFTHACKYFLEGEDQYDTNKLFGIGYFPSHHRDSARWGWRYNHKTNKIVLSAYCYVDGQRIIQELGEVPLMQPVTLRLDIAEHTYQFRSDKVFSADIPFTHQHKLSYPLHFYFGGNQTAPHDIIIGMENQ